MCVVGVGRGELLVRIVMFCWKHRESLVADADGDHLSRSTVAAVALSTWIAGNKGAYVKQGTIRCRSTTRFPLRQTMRMTWCLK